MHPKFEVGEVVILASPIDTEFNGEHVVTEFYFVTDEQYTGWAYLLDGVPPPHECMESSLRKKHLPGELSFTDLMASLSSPKLITHQAWALP